MAISVFPSLFCITIKTRPELNFAPVLEPVPVPEPPVISGTRLCHWYGVPEPVPCSITGTYHENVPIKL